jgi:glutathione peroxidase-family protein
MAQEQEGRTAGSYQDQSMLPPVLLIFSHLPFHPSVQFQWNFEKFLVDRSGNVVNRWISTSTPESIEPEIVKLINATG